MRVVVTAYRHWRSTDALIRKLNDLYEQCIALDEPFELATGACPTGGDMLTEVWARMMIRAQARPQVRLTTFPADWSKGSSAGPTRNRYMIDNFRPGLVVAFMHPQSRGTRQCAAYAREKGITVDEIWEGRSGDLV